MESAAPRRKALLVQIAVITTGRTEIANSPATTMLVTVNGSKLCVAYARTEAAEKPRKATVTRNWSSGG
jgi:hypothetical protein